MVFAQPTVVAAAILGCLVPAVMAASQDDLNRVRLAIYNDILPTQPVPGTCMVIISHVRALLPPWQDWLRLLTMR